MVFIKTFLIAVVAIGAFVLAALGLDKDDWLEKAGYVLAFIIGLIILNLIAKIAWRILFFILLIFFIVFALSYFKLIEFSKPGLTNAAKDVYSEIKIEK